MEKLNPVTPQSVTVAAQCGSIYPYNHDLDKSGTYKQIPVPEFTGKVYANVPTLEDPVIRRLAQENKADIFATEVAAAAIMTAPKSLYSWDVVIKKYGDKLFIDKRDEPNMLDNLTVNETSQENQPVDEEGPNGVRQIMEESVRVHNNFLYQQYSKAEERKHALGDKDPFMADEHEVCVRQGYVYKVYRLEGKRRICIRSTIHSYKSKTETESGETKITYQNTYTLLEYELGKSNWKQNLDMMMA